MILSTLFSKKKKGVFSDPRSCRPRLQRFHIFPDYAALLLRLAGYVRSTGLSLLTAMHASAILMQSGTTKGSTHVLSADRIPAVVL